MIYGFQLGSSRELGRDEIIAVLNRNQIAWQKVNLGEEFFGFSTKEPVKREIFFQLGGSVRLVEVLTLLQNKSFLEAKGEITKFILQALKESRGEKQISKISFAVSASPYSFAKLWLLRLLKEIKLGLKKEGIKARYIRPVKGITLSAKSLAKYDFPFLGQEFFIFRHGSSIFLAKTLAFQDVDSWVERDVGKPGRNLKKGLLPPKLARIMVNLAFDKPLLSKKPLILDPFCGSGTILIEALMLGFRVIGVDIDESQINLAKKNLHYLGELLEENLEECKIYQADALKLSSFPPLKSLRFDAVVSEPYLGPFLEKDLKFNKQAELASSLASFYLAFLKEARVILRDQAKLVLALPRWSKIGTAEQIIDELPRLGYYLNKTYIYHRVGQFVSREILILTI